MKTLLLSTLFFLAITTATAQSHRFADSTAQWNVIGTGIGWGCSCSHYSTESFAVIRDTTVSGNVYQMVNNELIRQDSQRVYLLEDTIERLIYDFSRVQGDTFSLTNLWNSPGLDVACHVDSTDTVVIGHARKRLYITYNGEQWRQDQWVEGVGSLFSHLLYPGVDHTIVDGDSYNLSCYWENGTQLYANHDFLACVLDTVIYIGISEVLDFRIDLFPNPVKNSFTLAFRQQPQPNSSLFIHDALGRLMKQEKLTSTIQQISVTDLPNGIYTYTITQNNVWQASGKLVVSH